MTLLSLQEVLDITKDTRKDVEAQMDRSGKQGGFHPEDASILGTEEHPLKDADFNNVKETLHTIPLKRLMEFLGKSATTGISGAYYVIPDKIYDIMFRQAWLADVTGRCSRFTEAPGGWIKIDYHLTGQYKAKYFGSGGELPTETLEIGQLTITPVTFGIRPEITNDLIEDQMWDTVQMHLEEAAKAMAQFSSASFVGTLVSASTGEGTQNAWTSANTTTTNFNDLLQAYALNADDGWFSDCVITSPYSIPDFKSDAGVAAYATDFHQKAITDPAMNMGNFAGMDLNFLTGEGAYGTAVLYSGSKWRTIVMDKMNASATLRKRWLKIDNYANPIKDLVGAVVSARESYKTIRKSAICLITEL
jgi:hypothetical protein